MRCAIYTRKSSREGLDQNLNSLDAQRLACSHYIASQIHEGWTELDVRYDDGGFSGGTLARPGLQQLLHDVDSGAIDTVVVHRIDRLSRSLRDFVRLLELFERRGVTFTSVTQQFSTTSSMGRLTFNILLAFAQFERELTIERTRDKFAALRSQGLRPSGGRPFGYQFVGRRLVIDEAEAAVINRIFRMFIRLKTPVSIPLALNEGGFCNHHGRPFTLPFIRRALHNRLYLGDLMHRGRATPGAHPAIITERTWAKARAVMEPHEGRWGARHSWGPGMLGGLLFSPVGPLRHDCGISKGKVYRYYALPKRLSQVLPRRAQMRFRAPELEQQVLEMIDLRRSWDREQSEAQATEHVRSVVERVEIGDLLSIRLKTGRTVEAPIRPWLLSSRLAGRQLMFGA